MRPNLPKRVAVQVVLGIALGMSVLVAAAETLRPRPTLSALTVPAFAPVEVLPKDFAVIDAVLARRARQFSEGVRKALAVAIIEEADRARYDPLLVLAIIDV